MQDTIMTPAETPYVLIKGGLYYRPNAQGYTGILRDAGTYSEEDSAHYARDAEGVTRQLRIEAEEIMPATFLDYQVTYWKAEALRLRALLQANPTHRHVKSGGDYILSGVGKMQAEGWFYYHSNGGHGSVDMREVVIYRSVADGSLWVRSLGEFNDGRFIQL